MGRLAEQRVVGSSWSWFADYINLWKKWTGVCPENRTVQVGMGMKSGGDPLGEKIRFSGNKQFTTVGAGSIHFRVADGGGPCLVQLYHGKVKGIRIPLPVNVLAESATTTLAEENNAAASVFSSTTSKAALESLEKFNAAAVELVKHFPIPDEEDDG